MPEPLASGHRLHNSGQRRHVESQEPPALLNDASIKLGEYAFPGPLRDALVSAILAGEKTSTSSLLIEYELAREALPEPGDLERIVDSSGQVACVSLVTAVSLIPCAQIPLSHALNEGEGFGTVDEWRAAHRLFWESEEFQQSLAILGHPAAGDFRLTDDTVIVCTSFRMIAAR